MKKHLLILLTAMLMTLGATAQVTLDRWVIGSAGDFGTTTGLNLSWTAGETEVTTGQSANITVTQGFQQGDDESVAIEEADIAGEIRVYPNPVEDLLYFDVRTDSELSLQAVLYDMQGRQVTTLPETRITEYYRGQLDMTGLPAGKWLLRFTDSEAGTKVFTIVKMK